MELQSTEGQVLTRYPDHLRQEILPSKSLKLKIPSIGLRFYRKYSVITYLLMFFLFAVIGWCWEVIIHLVEDHIFVNRGTMMGPWLPIYGIGGTVGVFVMTVFGKKILKHPALTFLIVMTLCGIIEYATSFVLEQIYGIRWWDYTGYFLNINGRICLEGIVIFGAGGCAAIYLIAPAFDDFLKKVSLKKKIILLLIACPLFLCDMIYSNIHPNIGKGITDYDSAYMAKNYCYSECIDENECDGSEKSQIFQNECFTYDF